MASSARPPGLADARIACPLCGGLIHPVAGRCKHCKEDLSTLRAGRPAAAAALPALVAARVAPAAGANGAGNGVHVAGNGAAAAAAIPLPVPIHDGSAPILPPRPTGRSVAAQRPASAWRSWPVVVIALAVLAIVTAVTIMVWPSHEAKAGKSIGDPPPAPDHMETNPLPPNGAQPSDPWGGTGQATPPAPRHTPDPPAKPPPGPDDTDVFGGLGGGGSVGGGQIDPFAGLGSASGVLSVVGKHLCDRMTQCGSSGGSTDMVAQMCQVLKMMPAAPAPSCAEVQRCIDKIDHMSCGDLTAQAGASGIVQLQDCVEAAARC